MKQDITNKEDIQLMVDSFYKKVNEDAILGPVFNDFAKVDWESHLPKMYSFWDSVLFSTATYQGRPFQKHIPLPISKEHFNRWLELFLANADELFEGPVTEEAKHRAQTIAHIFQTKLHHLNRL